MWTRRYDKLVQDTPVVMNSRAAHLVFRQSFFIITALFTLQITPVYANHPDITGTYTGSGSLTETACDDPGDNGTFSFSSSVSITSQSGESFNGTSVLTATIQGISLREELNISGTVTTEGVISGNFDFTLYANGSFDSSGNGTFSGQVSGTLLSANFEGRDINGDSCDLPGIGPVYRRNP